MGLFDRGPSKPETGDKPSAPPASGGAAFPDKGAAKQQAKPEATGKRYGIAQALALLRELPIDTNPDLVMRVVRKTLESNQVHVDDLVAEAKTCAGQLEQSIASERTTIAQLEHDIASRNATVSKLLHELAEMRHAGEHLAGALSVGAIKARPPAGAGTGTGSASGENPGEWERPSVMRLEERDLESIPSPEPVAPRGKGPGRS